jgi:CubicO group peptidase (beta-lactamase class C family)
MHSVVFISQPDRRPLYLQIIEQIKRRNELSFPGAAKRPTASRPSAPMLRTAALAIILAVSSRAQQAPDRYHQTSAVVVGLPPSVETDIDSLRREWEVPGMSIAVVKGDRVLLVRGFGVRRQGGGGDPIGPHTIFNVASLTKSFTSAAAAILIGEGRLGWDDRVRRWLPGFELADPWLANELTLRDLLSHRTGLEQGDSAWAFTHIDRSELIGRLRYFRQRTPFRAGFVYSNALYAVAGEVIAKAAGRSWETFVTDRLLKPVGMTDASIGIVDSTSGDVSAAHALIEGRGQVPITFSWDLNTAPAGGLNASASDMARWMLFQLGEGSIDGIRLLPAEALRETHEPQIVIPTTPAFRSSRNVEYFAAYGLGWQVMDYRGHPAIWHSGSAAGMPAYMILMPKDRIGIFVVLNSNPPVPLHGAIASRIADALLGVASTDPRADLRNSAGRAAQRQRDFEAELAKSRQPRSRPQMSLGAYPGVYANPAFGDIAIRSEGGRLTLRMGDRGEVADLVHWNNDTWRLDWRTPFLRESYDSWITFRVDAKPSVRSAMLKIGRDEFEAVRPD